MRFTGKRIAMVTYSPYPNDPRPRRAIEALLSEGAQIELVCLASEDVPRRKVSNGLEVIPIRMKHQRGGRLSYLFQYASFILISAAIFAKRSISQRRYDLVYVHNMPDILVLSALVPKMRGARVVLDLHDPMPELLMTIFRASEDSRSVRLLRHLEKWSIACADLVITVNIACQRIFAGRSCSREKIAVVMNAPDDQIFPFRAAEATQRVVPNASKRFVVMYHGSLVERNGLDVAIEAVARVRKVIPGLEFRIFGPKTPFLERMLGEARARGLDDVIRYLGPKRLEDLVTEISLCDLGVIPNHRNPFTEINTPTRIFEYLALGKPVIAPATQGIQDYFAKDSLLFFEAGNAADLAQQIAYAFSHPSEATQIARKGQQVYSRHQWPEERETLLGRICEACSH